MELAWAFFLCQQHVSLSRVFQFSLGMHASEAVQRQRPLLFTLMRFRSSSRSERFLGLSESIIMGWRALLVV